VAGIQFLNSIAVLQTDASIAILQADVLLVSLRSLCSLYLDFDSSATINDSVRVFYPVFLLQGYNCIIPNCQCRSYPLLYNHGEKLVHWVPAVGRGFLIGYRQIVRNTGGWHTRGSVSHKYSLPGWFCMFARISSLTLHTHISYSCICIAQHVLLSARLLPRRQKFLWAKL
jgi:hypothetical protein